MCNIINTETKAIFILNLIISERKLRPLCKSMGLSSKYIYSIAKGAKASDKIKEALKPIIQLEYWNEIADDDFKAIYLN